MIDLGQWSTADLFQLYSVRRLADRLAAGRVGGGSIA